MGKEAKISPQPEISVGLIGHVDHGKTTLVKALSGKWTDTHSEEIKRGITIRLGYADVVIYKCGKCCSYTVSSKCGECNEKTSPVRKISLVDAPGHESLMATMLCGANIMDYAFLLVAANEPCPQPQTMEHITALEIIGVEKIIVVQNKIDVIDDEKAMKNFSEIKEFLKGTKYAGAPVIPMSALHSINLDILLETVEKDFKTPKRDLAKSPLMLVARSFDINKPGTKPKDIAGGVLGGSLKQGRLKVGEDIEILPGYEAEEKNQKVWKSLRTKIASIVAGGEKADEAVPGGSFGIMTMLDPAIVKSDLLAGSIVGHIGKLPKVYSELKMEPHLLERVVGAKDKLVVEPIKKGEMLMININSAATAGIVQELGKIIFCKLRKAVCAAKGSRATISRNIGQRWKLIGYGTIVE